jgi:hypothetical protein
MNGIGGVAGGLGLPGLTPRAAREGEEQRPTTVDGSKPGPTAAAAAPAPSADGVLPSEAPVGTDPAFWSVLTTEERIFFARLQSLGPLTYGPRSAAPKAALARGGRLDVKV